MRDLPELAQRSAAALETASEEDRGTGAPHPPLPRRHLGAGRFAPRRRLCRAQGHARGRAERWRTRRTSSPHDERMGLALLALTRQGRGGYSRADQGRGGRDEGRGRWSDPPVVVAHVALEALLADVTSRGLVAELERGGLITPRCSNAWPATQRSWLPSMTRPATPCTRGEPGACRPRPSAASCGAGTATVVFPAGQRHLHQRPPHRALDPGGSDGSRQSGHACAGTTITRCTPNAGP